MTGVVTLGTDIEERYGREFAASALMHEFGHALAWRDYGWELDGFRERFASSMAVMGVERAYPLFARFVRRHYTEVFERTDYSELFPAVLLELRSAAVVPPPLRSYVERVLWP